ncbi:uncharacterized protein [Panulirus ornatus]|uniref:uncharacterized protein n=1 Tax=Panulirus ornatus TaxID=150431 RepID=UPI003A88F4CD
MTHRIFTDIATAAAVTQPSLHPEWLCDIESSCNVSGPAAPMSPDLKWSCSASGPLAFVLPYLKWSCSSWVPGPQWSCSCHDWIWSASVRLTSSKRGTAGPISLELFFSLSSVPAYLNGGCGFWGRAQPSEPQRPTPPTDKPPDQRQPQAQQQPQQQPQPQLSPQQQQQTYQSPQQPQQQLQTYQANPQPQPYQPSQQGQHQQPYHHDTQQVQQPQQQQQQPYHDQSYPQQQQLTYQQQQHQQLGIPSQQALVASTTPAGLGAGTPLTPSAHTTLPNPSLPSPLMLPIQQMPMGMSGYGGAPVYLVMQSPGGAATPGQPPGSAYIQDFLRNIPYSANQRGVTIYELPESAHQHRPGEGESVPPSATSSEGSRWSASPEPCRTSHQHPGISAAHDDRSAGRARWGDRGVGVGHLWAAGEEIAPCSRGNEVMTPAWAEKQDENVLPGAPLSKPGQRTYARGGGMSKMDPEELAERERRKKQAEETQRIIKLQSGSLPEVREEAEEPVSLSPRYSTTPRQRHQHRHHQQHQLKQSSEEQQQQHPSQAEQQQQQQPQEDPQQTQHKVASDTEERSKLLRNLGITPEVLLASSGLLDRATLLTLLQAATGQRLTSAQQYDYPADYITDRVITPTKYRGPPSRECGTQCDDPPPDSRDSPRRESRRRASRNKTSSLPRDSGQSSDARPPWGHNQSDRPYRKQSEKDPYSSRRFRRRTTRSLSRCDRDTATEESDQPQPQRRRRKTWDKSRQESLSSDISRSPSPRDRRRGSRTSSSSKQWPPIKQSLTPALHQPHTPEPAKQPPSSPLLSTPADVEERDEDDDDDVNVVTTQSPPLVRSTSPPVPALMRKLTGETSFDVPEFAPGTADATLRTASPPIPTLLKRLQSADSTPTLPEIPAQASRPASRPPSPKILTPANCLGPGSRPASSGSSPSLQGVVRADTAVSGRCSSQPSSPGSRPPTPRRLPPMTPSRSEELVASPCATPVIRSNSPPVPAVAKRLSAQTRPGQPPQETRVERQLTPVETPASPRHLPSSSPSASTASAATSGVSSRPGSATSGQDEDVRTVSVTSSGYESGRRSSGEPRSLSEPLVSPDKWVILKSLSSLRHNLWRRHQELSHHPDSDGSC